MKTEKLVTCTFEYETAKLLWDTCRDILSQDTEGKDNGTGGILYPHHVGNMMQAFGELARALDQSNERPSLVVVPASSVEVSSDENLLQPLPGLAGPSSSGLILQ